MGGVTEQNEVPSSSMPTLEQCIRKLTQLFRHHGTQSELIKGQKQGTKSELCASWLEGEFCSFFPHCHFAHGWADVKPRVCETKMFKVRPCLNSDKCLYATRCQFFHDDIVYTLTPELRVFYSEREKMHRITLACDNGKLLVISLREPENPTRCPFYVELMPYLAAIYTILPSMNPSFLNKMSKQTCPTVPHQVPQSKIKVQPQLGYSMLMRQHQQQQFAQMQHVQAAQAHAQAQAQHFAGTMTPPAAAHPAAAHAMQNPYRIQMPSQMPSYPQYFPMTAAQNHPELMTPGTPVLSENGTPKPIARPIVNMPDMAGSLSTPMSNPPTPLYVHPPVNAWSQIVPNPPTTATTAAANSMGPNPEAAGNLAATPPPLPHTTNAGAQTTPSTHVSLATCPMSQMPNDTGKIAYSSNIGDVMQQFGTLNLGLEFNNNEVATYDNDYNTSAVI